MTNEELALGLQHCDWLIQVSVMTNEQLALGLQHCNWLIQVSVMTNEELALGLQQPAGIGQRPRPMSTETVISSGGSRTGSTDVDQSDDTSAVPPNQNIGGSSGRTFLPSARNTGNQHKKSHGQ